VKVTSEVVRLKIGSEIVLFVFIMVNSSFGVGLSAAVTQGASELISPAEAAPLASPTPEKLDRIKPHTIITAMQEAFDWRLIQIPTQQETNVRN
jgi:hypothetical protein